MHNIFRSQRNALTFSWVLIYVLLMHCLSNVNWIFISKPFWQWWSKIITWQRIGHYLRQEAHVAHQNSLKYNIAKYCSLAFVLSVKHVFLQIKWQWCGSLHVSNWFCNFQGLYESEKYFFNKYARHGSNKHDNGERLRSTAFLAQQPHDTHNAFIINVNV